MLNIAQIRKQLDGHSGASNNINQINLKPVNILWRREEAAPWTWREVTFQLNGFDEGQTSADYSVNYFRS